MVFEKSSRGAKTSGGRRGAALVTVLALVTVILVAGLAMGSLSTLSLQFNKRQLDRTRSELAARGGLALFLSKMQEYNATSTLNPLVPDSLDLSKLFKEPIVYQQDNYKVTVDFNQYKEGHSVDNLSGELAKLGWPDTDVPKIPPFSLDLILNVEGPSGLIRYRATLKRVWPFAVYTSVGPVALMGQPEPGTPNPYPQPSHVQGKVYTQWFGDSGNGGTVNTGYGFGPLTDPSDVLANVEARAGYQPTQKLQHPLIIGLNLIKNPTEIPQVVEKRPDEIFYKYSLGQLKRKLNQMETDPVFSPSGPTVVDKKNVLDGDFVYDHDKGVKIGPSLGGDPGDNLHNGEIVLKRGLALDPLAEMKKTGNDPAQAFAGKSFTKVPMSLPPLDTESVFGLSDLTAVGGGKGNGNGNGAVSTVVEKDDDDGAEPFLLTKTLKLTEADGAHFEIDGSVSNRQVLYCDTADDAHNGLFVREVDAGLELQGVVLHVKGDLDLGATQLDKPIPISGAGATLVVDGKLVLGNAHIDAQDQGFVIYAKDIVLKGGGTFYGLMVASNSITILSQEKKPLHIEGALMCGGPGGVTLRGADIKHEPRYLKSINGGGDLVLTCWSKLND